MLDIMLGLYELMLLLIIIDKIIVIVGLVMDNFFICEMFGVICGFDVNSGKFMWVFDLGVKDLNVILVDEYVFIFNLLNFWVFVVYDVKLDLVYLLMGVIMLDIWGGNCMLEQECYVSFILVLNVIIGKLVWSYQIVYYDLWDMDLLVQLMLVDIIVDGIIVLVIYVLVKIGNIFVFDRCNGELVVFVLEKLVLQGVVKGDYVVKIQLFFDLIFCLKKDFFGVDMWGVIMFD